MIIKQIRLGTPVDIYQEIQEINEDIFNGGLPTPILEIEHNQDFDGYMEYYDGVYHIGVALGLSYDTAITTIIHEMIHIWQHQRGMVEMRHDTTFNRKCREAELFYNYPIKSIQGINNTNIVAQVRSNAA